VPAQLGQLGAVDRDAQGWVALLGRFDVVGLAVHGSAIRLVDLGRHWLEQLAGPRMLAPVVGQRLARQQTTLGERLEEVERAMTPRRILSRAP
jgi:hypothetical protein